MNQRSFFKSLALIGAAASVSPQIFLPRFEPVRWRAPILFKREPGLEYKVFYFDMPAMFDQRILDNCVPMDGWQECLTGKWPVKFHLDEPGKLAVMCQREVCRY